ncbi:hypothetical protein OV208_21395 [Corallococcus sp. bb12-1]|uniref:hypothetical protein n=1 Tax=Corallococcus sp. bb12-1 TaxID=2996784 RepID=UPI0022721077|nr:hypothetical protein [Corallococcus sp. bb12-1]MCY1043886.1 hypothetical protein [Corallococcus sp. bb12-1]
MVVCVMLRCNDCSRPVAARWPRCRGCHAVQHRPYGTSVAILDAWLDTLRNFGASLCFPLLGAAVALHVNDHPLPAVLLGLYAGLLLASHLLLPCFTLTWHIAQGLWGVGVLASLALLPLGFAEVAVFAVTPALVAAAMWRWRKRDAQDRRAHEPTGALKRARLGSTGAQRFLSRKTRLPAPP